MRGGPRGSYVHSLVLTDIASEWTEAAPIIVREGILVVETLEGIRAGLPFALTARRWLRAIIRQTPCERLLQAEGVPMASKSKLREIAADLDPLKLLEEIACCAGLSGSIG